MRDVCFLVIEEPVTCSNHRNIIGNLFIFIYIYICLPNDIRTFQVFFKLLNWYNEIKEEKFLYTNSSLPHYKKSSYVEIF